MTDEQLKNALEMLIAGLEEAIKILLESDGNMKALGILSRQIAAAKAELEAFD